MHGKLTTSAPRLRRLRVDMNETDPRRLTFAAWLVVLALGGVFVLVSAGDLDLDAQQARLGLSASEPFGPLGQALGGWDPSAWPGKVALVQLWASLQGPSHPGVVRWPAALATLGIGLIVARRLTRVLGVRAGLLGACCLFGSLGLIDHSSSLGIDAVTGLGVIAALDRILARGSDWWAGLWASVALLCGGWPAVAAILLPILVLGRPGAGLSARLLIPPIVTLVVWSLWALKVAPAEAWAAALTLPLTQGLAWWLPAQVLAAGLPWVPFAMLAAWPGLRLGWGPRGGELVRGWLHVVGACILAGTLIPGLASATRLPAVVGLLVVAAACLDRMWLNLGTSLPRRTFTSLAVAVAVIGGLTADLSGIYLAAAVPYYRAIAITLMVLGSFTGVLAVAGAVRGRQRLLIGTVAGVAVALKLAHGGVYAPEWNYRFGQGPWGRAVAQWVPSHSTIYTMHAWPADFAFATGRPFRPLADPRLLNYEPQDRPLFVLLDPGEFQFWNATAPKLMKVREFLGPRGEVRVLARTRPDLVVQPTRD